MSCGLLSSVLNGIAYKAISYVLSIFPVLENNISVMRKNFHKVFVFLFVFGVGQSLPAQQNSQDPLPSWAEGNVKKAIITYIEKVVDSQSSGFIPVKDRIATFDNDGTLWAERPLVQEVFAFYQVRKMVATNPA